MEETAPQSFETHVRRIPRLYLLAGAVLALNIVATTAHLVWRPGWISGFLVLVAVALFGTHWFVRSNAIVVQDRVIRLEERLRLERLLPEQLRPRIGELSLGQLVALRFASDDELAELTSLVLDEGLTGRTEIKKRIRTWRPDHLRV